MITGIVSFGAARSPRPGHWRVPMKAERFKVGDLVTWNSEAGHVSGRIIKVYTRDVDYKGHTHRASDDEPQYEIKSTKTDHVAMHKGSALKKSDE